MVRLLLLFTIFHNIIFSEKYDPGQIKYGKRGEKYRLWIFFKDKNESIPITLNKKAVERRNKNGFLLEESWYDLSVSNLYKEQISSIGIDIINESRWLNAVSVLCSFNDLKDLTKFEFVDSIRPVIGYKKNYYDQYNENNSNTVHVDYGYAQQQIEQINVHLIHELGFTGQGVRILVMDTGFDLGHNAFNSINVIAQWDFINDDNQTANENDQEETASQDFHGTAVLSTIAASSPGELMGVAYDAEFLLAKTEDVTQEIQQEEDNYVAGLEWGEENGADVVSTSLGYLDWYEYSDLDGNTAVTTIAVDIAVGLGIVCVTAAGNSGNDDWYYIIAPADADSVIAVGAVSESGEIASFSSHGPTADGRIKPEVCARGRQTWCVNPNSTTSYTQLSGTSLSCPLVAGAAALILQARPNWSAMEVRESIMMTASMADSANNTYGYGIVNTLDALSYFTESNIGYEYNTQPVEFNLMRTYPNPFNPKINIQVMAKASRKLKIDIFSYNGSHIETIYQNKIEKGSIHLMWEPASLPSGIYFIRLNDGISQTLKKITYLK
tara:strand:- start:4491 stop:6149 length:1659 start_codon:yes stop_codon:yes gene_type:complete